MWRKMKPARMITWRNLAAALLLIASGWYVWQLVSLWVVEQSRADQYDIHLGTRDLLSGRPPLTLEFSGSGIAAGASAQIRFNNRGYNGVLRLQDMPVLPDTRVYQLWCIDRGGAMDRCTSFNVPVNTQEPTIIGIEAPRMLVAYTHFMITVEAMDDNPVTPSEQVVMVN